MNHKVALYYLLTVMLSWQRLYAKLALELSSKSTELFSNSIQSNNHDNDEIPIAMLHLEKQQIQKGKEKEKENVVDNNVNKEDDVVEDGEVIVEGPKEFEINLNDAEEAKMQSKAKSNAIEKKSEEQQQLIMNQKRNLIKIMNKKIFNTTSSSSLSSSLSSSSLLSTMNLVKGIKVTTNNIKPLTAAISPKYQQQQRPYNFVVNPFGQLSAFLGGDQLQYLQDYNFLFNAERHTVFQLHTCLTTTISNANTNSNNMSNNTISSGRVLNVVSGSLSAAFGVNPLTSVGAGSSNSNRKPATKIEEVKLYNAASLRQSRYNPFNPTRILIHGWFGGSNAGVYNTLVPAYLKLDNGSFNVFTVDWGRGAFADYITASYRVKPVGRVVAKFIDFLHREAGMRFEDLHVIGFSMGAHIAGISGKYVETGRLPIIYALDPALPLFRYETIDERIALTDADYVEVIHTSVGTYGYDRPMGHVDFYVNYGSGQPGCFFNECSHFRAFQIFAESLQSSKAFRGQGCDVKLWLDLIKTRRCLMGTGRNLTLGGDPRDSVALRKRGGGVYYFTTNASSPYGRGNGG